MYNLNYLIDMVFFSFGIESFYVQQDDRVYSHHPLLCEKCPLNICQQCKASWRVGSSISRQLSKPYLYLCPMGLSFVIIAGLLQDQCLQHDFFAAGPVVMGDGTGILENQLRACRDKDPQWAEQLDRLPRRKEDVLLYVADTIYLAYQATVCRDLIDSSLSAPAVSRPTEGTDLSHSLLDHTRRLSEMLFGSIAAGENEIGEVIGQIMSAVQQEEYGNLKRIRDKTGKLYLHLYELYREKLGEDPALPAGQILARENRIISAETFEEVRERFSQAAELLYCNRYHTASKTDNQLIRRMQDIVAERYMTSLSLADVAGEINISYSYLSSLINKTLGKGFNQYLKEVRIQASKPLLRSSSLSIAQISQSVGFADQSHFTKSFRAVAGMSPQQYRTAKG